MVDTSLDLEFIVTSKQVLLQRSGDENQLPYSDNESLRVDILLKLYINHLWLVVRTILLLLPTIDLYRVVHVSKKWRMICSRDRSIKSE